VARVCARHAMMRMGKALLRGRRNTSAFHDGGGTPSAVATCADNGRQRRLLWRAYARATRGCGWGRCSWGAEATREPFMATAARRQQRWTPIHLRGVLPGIISKIIRNMGLDDIFGSECAFLSELMTILQTAQAADFVVRSVDLCYSSISDRNGSFMLEDVLRSGHG